ncbi:Fic family protein [Promethearchaeum syntrophicum]|uniref:Fic family protein n=1 Tax=Promethearchaeum syntrophicum TaxID=2594042 RepID=A0A5B9DBM8_9ARCH|nr:Fic family protein [Candidatus Prometheoarchaeum syntrophicum]QEE16431.1 Fic/DOC family protein [Candidatus Prometheoarchaeum syntrophicum]
MEMLKRVRNKRNYYSFVYSYRQNNHLKHIEKGIGYDTIPPFEILDKKKDEFYNKIIEKRFKDDFSKIKSGYDYFLTYPTELKKQELRKFGINFTFNSNRIEGSTLSYRDTQMLLDEDISPVKRSFKDCLEIYFHMKSFNILLDSKKEISVKFILELHKSLFSETKSDIAGKLRKGNVSIRNSKAKFPPHENVKVLMKQLIQWYNAKKRIYHPVLLAGLFKYKIVGLIHNFADGNGRVSRMLMNYILYKNGYPMVNIRYKDRFSYYTALERSNLQDNEMIFINWFLKYYLRNDYFKFYL